MNFLKGIWAMFFKPANCGAYQFRHCTPLDWALHFPNPEMKRRAVISYLMLDRIVELAMFTDWRDLDG